MFSRRKKQRLQRIIGFAVLALLINIVIPGRVTAAEHSLVDSGNSHTVIVQTPTSEPTAVILTTLPVVPDKPVLKRLVVRASAYSSTVDQCDGDPFTTASGEKVHDGIIAMNGIPFGTKIRIPGYFNDQVFTVTDRMAAYWGNHRIDIWMVSREAAKDWGVRTVTIEILA